MKTFAVGKSGSHTLEIFIKVIIPGLIMAMIISGCTETIENPSEKRVKVSDYNSIHIEGELFVQTGIRIGDLARRHYIHCRECLCPAPGYEQTCG